MIPIDGEPQNVRFSLLDVWQRYGVPCPGRKGTVAAVALVTAMVTCAGCWEEIHYTPPSPVAESADADQDENAAYQVNQAVAEPASSPSAEDVDMAAEPAAPPVAVDEPTPAAPPVSTELAAVEMPTADPPAPPPEATSPAESTATEEEKTATPNQQRLAWRVASKWSLAAAAYAKGLDPSRYEPLRQDAATAAAELSLDLPELPSDESGEREIAVIESLRTGPGAQLSNALTQRFGPPTGAMAKLAMGSHLLLLVYSPQNPDAESLAAGIRTAGQASGLPSDLWQPLADLIEKHADFLTVRSAVFDLHRRVEEHLGRL